MRKLGNHVVYCHHNNMFPNDSIMWIDLGKKDHGQCYNIGWKIPMTANGL